MNEERRSKTRPAPAWMLAAGIAILVPSAGRADEAVAPPPHGVLVTLTSPIDGEDYALVSRSALKLQAEAVRERRPAYLFLVVPDGASEFYQVFGIADFLSSDRLPDVTVVTWFPQSVTGNNAILALASDEVVVAPEAELGDIGRGKALDLEKQDQVLKLVARGRNPLLNDALARAMMDPAADLTWAKITMQVGGEQRESIRLLSSQELTRLQDQGVLTPEVRQIKTAGARGVFSGSKLKQLGVLITETVSSRADLTRQYGLAPEALTEAGVDPRESVVRRIQLLGVIDWDTEFLIGRQIDRAIENGANTIILEIDSPGGYLHTSVGLAERLAALADRNVRTIAYIPREAISGGAIVALGCDEIYLHPDAKIGDAGPIEMRSGGQFEHVPAKQIGYLMTAFESLAEKKGRPAAIMYSMIDLSTTVYRVTDRDSGRVWYMSDAEIENSNGKWIRGPIVDGTQEGKLLTVTGKRAEELAIGEAPVSGLDDLKQRIGLPLETDLTPMQQHWVDGFVVLLNTRAAMFLLFVGGIGFLYLEMHLPSGFFGLMAALCFVLFFWARFLGGTAGWLEALLFLLGLACIAIEIFVLPGIGVVGIGGTILVIASMVMASQTFGEMSGSDSSREVLKSLGTLFGAGVTVIVFAAVMSHFLPQIPLFSNLILSPPGVDDRDRSGEPRLKPSLGGESPFAELLGQRGESMTLLKPFGKARIAGRLLEVVSQGDLIPPGTPIVVVEVESRRIVVRAEDSA